MQPEHQQRLARAERSLQARGELATLAASLREIGELDPGSLPELQAMKNLPAQPIRLSYTREEGGFALHARRALGGPGEQGVRCAAIQVPDWLFDPGAPAPGEFDDGARLDLVELVRASFAVFEARLAEHFDFAAGSDTTLAADPGPPPTLAIRPATRPSSRLQPALPTQAIAEGSPTDGDPPAASAGRLGH